MKRPILILTTAFGEGHNAAARNLAKALPLLDADRPVIVRDVFAEAYGPLYILVQRIYFLLINHFPLVWGAFYSLLDRDKAAPKRVGIYKRGIRLLRRILEEESPSVIVSTYPGYNLILDHVHSGKAPHERPHRTVTVVTDSISINALWYRGHSDLYLVPNDLTADVMKKAGVREELLRITGFPVPPAFESLRGNRPSPDDSHPPKVLYLANPGQKHAVEILGELAEIEGITLSVACGRDEGLRAKMQAVASKLETPLKIQGWLEDLPGIMASSHLVVAKAGGATVQECLAAGTPLVMSQVIPGQEEGNAKLLTMSECGCAATSPKTAAAAVRHAFSRGAGLWRTWEANALKTGTPEGARNSAKEVLREAELLAD
jgi:processive 1,2-diacylglycerol beta-glucosyltransferase